MHKLLVSDSGGYPECSANGPDGRYQVANLVMRLLLSKDGVVLRRLLMTAVRIMIYIILMLVFIALFLVKPATLLYFNSPYTWALWWGYQLLFLSSIPTNLQLRVNHYSLYVVIDTYLLWSNQAFRIRFGVWHCYARVTSIWLTRTKSHQRSNNLYRSSKK